jgi:hypothetical protein
MKKIYVAPALEVFNTESEQMICASNDPNGVVGGNGTAQFDDENPNSQGGQPGFGGYVAGNDAPPSTAKELDLWGDFEW